MTFCGFKTYHMGARLVYGVWYRILLVHVQWIHTIISHPISAALPVLNFVYAWSPKVSLLMMQDDDAAETIEIHFFLKIYIKSSFESAHEWMGHVHIHTFPWKSMEVHDESPWNSSMEFHSFHQTFHGSPWNFLGTPWSCHGGSRNFIKWNGRPMEIHGSPWNFIDVHEYLQLHSWIVLHGCPVTFLSWTFLEMFHNISWTTCHGHWLMICIHERPWTFMKCLMNIENVHRKFRFSWAVNELFPFHERPWTFTACFCSCVDCTDTGCFVYPSWEWLWGTC